MASRSDEAHSQFGQLCVRCIEQCTQKTAKNPHGCKDWELPHKIAPILKSTELHWNCCAERSPLCHVVHRPREEAHSKASHRGANKGAHQDRGIHVRRAFLDSEQHPPNRGAEGSSHSRRCTGGHKVACFGVQAVGCDQRARIEAGHRGGHDGARVDHRPFLPTRQPCAHAANDAEGLGRKRSKKENIGKVDAIQNALDLRDPTATCQWLHIAHQGACDGNQSHTCTHPSNVANAKTMSLIEKKTLSFHLCFSELLQGECYKDCNYARTNASNAQVEPSESAL
mmetsp:Transcript_69800/g.175821  ORF Transcript_69800/g.175821 Transcript_69800/m.175821 type:complete len:283 (-) Transcript_69800:238-1086(-)